MPRKQYIIHAPGSQGYDYCLVRNTSDGLSPFTWHHSGYGLQAAFKFSSRAAALRVVNDGFTHAAEYPARVDEVEVRRAFCATTQGGERTYWLCPDWQFKNTLKWRPGGREKSYSAQRFSTAGLAQVAARKVALPQGAGKILVMPIPEVVLVG